MRGMIHSAGKVIYSQVQVQHKQGGLEKEGRGGRGYRRRSESGMEERQRWGFRVRGDGQEQTRETGRDRGLKRLGIGERKGSGSDKRKREGIDEGKRVGTGQRGIVGNRWEEKVKDKRRIWRVHSDESRFGLVQGKG